MTKMTVTMTTSHHKMTMFMPVTSNQSLIGLSHWLVAFGVTGAQCMGNTDIPPRKMITK